MDVLPLLNASLAGRYFIERQIGQGGMATVYLARDVKHDRHVALKVLDPDLGAVVGKDRFLAEIGVTARLQHPHLLPLFDSGEADGQLFYVMPYVQGESLRDRLQREKQLPIDEAVRIAATVALALAHAHRQGVIHRDLKPENILLQDGQPLVADFGIALALSIAGGARITQTGLSLGTPQYMSPEQATGDRVIDARTDIYSLGAMTYEMLTGDPPHTGSTAQAVIARVLTDKPRPIRLTRDAVPRHVEAAVECALAKLPADRFATASDFADALRGTRPASVPASYVTPGSTTSDPSLRTTRRRRWPSVLPWVVAAIATLAAVALWRRPAPPAPLRRFELADALVRFRTSSGVTVALSPDGSRLVYAGGPEAAGQLYLHDLSQLAPVPLKGTDRAQSPIFSPDGRSLLFLADGRLKRIDLDGGSPVIVSDSGGPAAWSGNRIIFTRGSAVYEVPAVGGPVRRVVDTTALPRVTGFAWPAALPGGEAALVTIRHVGGPAMTSIGVVRLSDGKLSDLNVLGLNPRYLPTGHIVFGRADGSAYGMAFDVKRLRPSGPIVPLLEGVVVKNGGATEITFANDGTMAYRTGAFLRRVVLVDRRGVPSPLIEDVRDYSFPSASPDGRRVAVSIGASTSTSDTWIFDRQTSTLTRLTRGGGERPEWTPDGQRVLTMIQDGFGRIVAQRWDGSGTPELYATNPQGILEISLPRGGTGFMAARVGTAAGQRDIWIAPVDSPGALRPFVATDADEFTPSVSPDGKYLAYISGESGRFEVYVKEMTGSGRRVPVSNTGAIEPVWSPVGRELFYRADRKIMAARITGEGGGTRVERETLFDDVYASSGNAHTSYAMMPDGKHFVFSQSAGEDPKVIVVLNWFDEVKRRMAAVSPR